VVLSIHDLNFLYENKAQYKKEKYLRHLQHNIDRADAIVCISDFCKKDVVQHCDTQGKPLQVIHNGTNLLEKPQLTGLSYKPTRPFLFTIGVMNRKKNFHSLLPLLQHNNNMELLIAGRLDDADYLHYINDMARRLHVSDHVRVLGQISEQEKAWYFNHCYAFTFPSLAEGFGLPVTEAMSAGKPLFLSDRTALPEIGRDVAFYFNDFNAEHMQRVFASGMQDYARENMQEAIKKQGALFCWHKAAREYIDLYRSFY
jgi:glycosyltransferase involved in cell wall biosynthesis